MNIQWIKSPNFKPGNNPKILLIHYTASGTMDGTVATFSKVGGLSCHYIIDKEGKIVQMVEDNNCAFHAGKSDFGELDWLNNDSIGIELVNWGKLVKDSERKIQRWTGAEHTQPYHYLNGKYWDHFTFLQMASLVWLTKLILKRNPAIEWITGHDYVSAGRKDDPGPAFDWNNYLLEVGALK